MHDSGSKCSSVGYQIGYQLRGRWNDTRACALSRSLTHSLTQGRTGPTGSMGPRGRKGKTGPTGAMGKAGAMGPTVTSRMCV